MKRIGLALGGALALALLVPVAVGDPPQTVTFSHPDHRAVFEDKGVACVHCHPVGAGMETLPEAPLSSCHACHQREIAGVPRKADRTCDTCHTDLSQILPETHALVDWHVAHAADARSMRSGCKDCHDSGWCVDCHDMRGALSTNPHPPAFFATHGVDARLDPASCGSCHSGDTCRTCHVDGAPIR